MTVDTYKIKKNLLAKKLEIEVGTDLTMEKTEQFIKDYSLNVASITPSEFDLEVNCKSMKVLTQDLAAKLEQALMMYKQAGFKNIIVLLSDDVVLSMQISRLSRKVGIKLDIRN